MSSRHRDFVAEVGKRGFQVVGFVLSCTAVRDFYTAPSSMSSSRTYEHFSKNLVHDVTFFCRSTAVKQCFFVHISLVFEARLKTIAASAT